MVSCSVGLCAWFNGPLLPSWISYSSMTGPELSFCTGICKLYSHKNCFEMNHMICSLHFHLAWKIELWIILQHLFPRAMQLILEHFQSYGLCGSLGIMKEGSTQRWILFICNSVELWLCLQWNMEKPNPVWNIHTHIHTHTHKKTNILKEPVHFKSKYICTCANKLNIDTLTCNSPIKTIISTIQMKKQNLRGLSLAILRKNNETILLQSIVLPALQKKKF